MHNLETIERVFGRREKPLHLTGEITRRDYLRRLNPTDRVYLTLLMSYLLSAACHLDTRLSILAVGSSADLQADYKDIDLVICPENPQKRLPFIKATGDIMSDDERLIVSRWHPAGSSLLISPFIPSKLFVKTTGKVNGENGCLGFDLSFLGPNEESDKNMLLFHRRNQLAFCRLT